MSNPFDDPDFQPASNIARADARVYEEGIVSLPLQHGAGLEQVRLPGERPAIEIVLRFVRRP